MTLTVTYLLTFFAGPMAYWVLARRPHGPVYFAMLGGLTALVIAGAVWVMRYGDPSPALGLAVIVGFWFGWILVLALLVLAFRRRTKDTATHRLIFALGAMATTLPWFGLTAARIMSTP